MILLTGVEKYLLIEELKSLFGHPTIENTNLCRDVHHIIGLINTDLFCIKVSNIFTVSKLRSKNDILAIISLVYCTATMQIITY